MPSLPPGPDVRNGFRFRGGHVALDLTATLAGRRRPAPRELLPTPDALARWLVAAGLVAPAPDVTPHDLDDARVLREAVYTLARAAAVGHPLDGADGTDAARATLNALAARPDAAPRLGADGRVTRDGPAAAVLATLAREAVLLLGGPQAARIRRCAGETCALLFLDLSRTGNRRWCAMTACGNRAKVAAFRQRRPGADPGQGGDR